MNFSKTTEYALRILSFMAKDDTKLYSVNEIYDALKIPLRYLKKQMTVLSKSGLIKSIQGRQGGYKIAGNIRNIYLYDIISVTEDNILQNVCFFGYPDCNRRPHCVMHEKWASVRENMIGVLKKTSLNDLKEVQNKKTI